MYLNQYWRDERLAFNAYSSMMENLEEKEYMSINEDEEDAKDVITLSGDFAEKIWVPDTFFANDKNRSDRKCIFIVRRSKAKNKKHRFSLKIKLSPRCHWKKQARSLSWRWFGNLWNAIHNNPRLHDGSALLSTRFTELHSWNRKL